MIEGGLHVAGLPAHDEVDHDAQDGGSGGGWAGWRWSWALRCCWVVFSAPQATRVVVGAFVAGALTMLVALLVEWCVRLLRNWRRFNGS